jgi:hypothetical protein
MRRYEPPPSDVFSVERTADAFIVTHYRSRDTKNPCCQATIKSHSGETEIESLRRASDEIYGKHKKLDIESSKR